MSKSRFRVQGKLGRTRLEEGTVTIDRSAGLFTVRPLRSRRTYTLPLSAVAELVVWQICRADAAAKRLEKAKAKREKAKEVAAMRRLRRKRKA